MSHTPLIDRWPSLSVFAEDINVAYGTAKAMRRRGTIPSEYWAAAVEKSAQRGIAGVTFETLAQAVDKRQPTPAGAAA
ncbi:MAG: hypothetical protein KIS96_11435 [Bauldia sp.]|nr:hypothetical protein [Bauldia sp.]